MLRGASRFGRALFAVKFIRGRGAVSVGCQSQAVEGRSRSVREVAKATGNG